MKCLLCAVYGVLCGGGILMRTVSRIMGNWTDSARELGRLKSIVICGIMAALAVVLSFTGTIRIGSYIRIGLSGVPERMVNFLYGPVVGGIFGAMLDILEYIVTPSGAFFPGFTISAALTGILYGAFLYKRKLTVWSVLIPEILVRVFVNLILNTYWLTILYGEGFFVLLPGRVASNLIQIPFETALIYLVLQATSRIAAKTGLTE